MGQPLEKCSPSYFYSPVGIGIPWQFSKQISKLFFQMNLQALFSLLNRRGEEVLLLEGASDGKGGGGGVEAQREITPKSAWLL